MNDDETNDMDRKAEIYPDDQVPDVTIEECYEYECGSYCSPDGCHGHVTDAPTHIMIDNVCFVVDGFDGGDYPMFKAEVEEVKSVIKRLQLALEKLKNDK
jgi:hypothetical protein